MINGIDVKVFAYYAALAGSVAVFGLSIWMTRINSFLIVVVVYPNTAAACFGCCCSFSPGNVIVWIANTPLTRREAGFKAFNYGYGA